MWSLFDQSLWQNQRHELVGSQQKEIGGFQEFAPMITYTILFPHRDSASHSYFDIKAVSHLLP